jgi:ketosteroid isomerase-like protein
MDIKNIIENWLTVSNNYDTEKYLDFFLTEAVLNDPSVGREFKGHNGIRNYFESYFIGYQTQTKIVKLDIKDENHAHLEVEFTGNFPEGVIGGMFDFTFENDKIAFIKADLI